MSHDKAREIRLNPRDADKYFPKSNMRFTDVSLYSSTPPDQAQYTADLLLNYYTKEQLKNKVLTDASSCIGGNTWTFANMVKSVNAVEIEPLHFEILKHNMGEMKYDNIKFILSDYTKLIDVTNNPVKQDIIFLDPPWGGVDYREGVTLKYNDILLEDVIDTIAYQAELVVCKVPNNTNNTTIKRMKESIFSYYDEILVETKNKQPIYKLIFLSHIPVIHTQPKQSFDKLGYRAIKYNYV